jgi:hypothetical protein
MVREAVLGIAPENPVISLAVAVNILAGITGSASGGLSIALQTLGSTYLELALQARIDPELLHRVASIATGGLDALPQNGAVITLLTICKLTHREAYLNIFVVAALVPLFALAAVIALSAFSEPSKRVDATILDYGLQEDLESGVIAATNRGLKSLVTNLNFVKISGSGSMFIPSYSPIVTPRSPAN